MPAVFFGGKKLSFFTLFDIMSFIFCILAVQFE